MSEFVYLHRGVYMLYQSIDFTRRAMNKIFIEPGMKKGFKCDDYNWGSPDKYSWKIHYGYF